MKDSTWANIDMDALRVTFLSADFFGLGLEYFRISRLSTMASSPLVGAEEVGWDAGYDFYRVWILYGPDSRACSHNVSVPEWTCRCVT